MTADGFAYTLDNSWARAHRRLTVLESIYDPSTISRLTALGVGEGWRCLELGPGAGSITRWLCDRVGPAGTVTAVDLEPRFVEVDPRPNLEIHRRDIVADGIPGDGYDLIHARALLMHLPGPDRLVAGLVRRLRPGGAILLEEADIYPTAAADSALYAEVWERCGVAVAKTGGDFCWARHLPAALAAAGATGVATAVDGGIFAGGTTWAELIAMTWEQLIPRLVADGFPAELVAAATAELDAADRWFPAPALVAAWGRRPL